MRSLLSLSPLLFFVIFNLLSCAKQAVNIDTIPTETVVATDTVETVTSTETPVPMDSTSNENIDMTEGTFNLNQDSQAVVTAVSHTGSDGSYTFSVELKSPDTGCDQYADWWEIFDKEGQLLYRRVLGHSHVNEQPFTRSGGPVAITPTTFIYIRGHMNPQGYGSLIFSGTIQDGFAAAELPIEFAADLVSADPLPTGCAF